MKYIKKNNEPSSYKTWRKAPLPDGSQKTFKKDLLGSMKTMVKKSLMKEQGYICCYCEREIKYNDCHIEHFIPKHIPSVDCLDYTNMLCSCIKLRPPIRKSHCGHHKDRISGTNIISPLDPQCEDEFTYDMQGKVFCTCAYTVKVLNLNFEALRKSREEMLEGILESDFTEDELEKILFENNRYHEFYSTIRFLFNRLIAV